MENISRLSLNEEQLKGVKSSLGAVFESAWTNPRGRAGLMVSTWMAVGVELDLETLLSTISDISLDHVSSLVQEIDVDSSSLYLGVSESSIGGAH